MEECEKVVFHFRLTDFKVVTLWTIEGDREFQLVVVLASVVLISIMICGEIVHMSELVDQELLTVRLDYEFLGNSHH